MGKKRIVKKQGGSSAKAGAKNTAPSKKKLTSGTLHIEATFNNTKAVLTDKNGNSFFWSSSGSLGFKGARKGTPYAASKVGETLAEKAEMAGLKDVDVVIRGVGSGREPLARAFLAKGFDLTGIKDETPVPHNGVRAKKARRV
ncbi:30S ribosomal protein S11 [Candidatus Nomurabacteria bacterium]|nr:30S ribosomal protein S11 [Candidatus Nomurabacteria bacterium]USN94957.1 MAG: 30S ribosomal protein S11 [Candidatus Nomurabacteria bacterium]